MVTVIIPTYNRAKTLRRSIDSVLQQTYSDLELIIVDDCSTDNTSTLIQEIADSRVRYIRLQHNQGACVARNTGIENARGEYIAFQDSDDVWLPDKLKKQMSVMEETGAEVCFHKLHRYYHTQRKDSFFPPLPESRFVTHRDFCNTTSLISTQTIIGQRAVFEEHRFDPLVRKAQDYDWSIRASRNHTFYYLNEILAEVYMQPDSISAQNVEVNLATKQYFLKKYKDEIRDNPLFELTLLRSIAGSKLCLGDGALAERRRIFDLTHRPSDALRLTLSRLGLLPIMFRLLNKKVESNVP